MKKPVALKLRAHASPDAVYMYQLRLELTSFIGRTQPNIEVWFKTRVLHPSIELTAQN